MVVQRDNVTVDEWEVIVGEQVRAARITGGLDQASLASAADVSIGALANLERGQGSSLKTVIAVIRALGRTDWLQALAPPIEVSPLQLLRAKRSSPTPTSTRQRVRKRTR